MTFVTPLDIVNRALQHCGVRRIATFNDPTSQAQELAFMYDKLRDAEIRRNQWRFATKRVVLRPTDIDTLLWKPPAWDNTGGTVYAVGAVVDYTPPGAETDFYWVCNVSNNATTTPDLSLQWTRYFGPVTADLWLNPKGNPIPVTPQVSYFTGEIVIVPATWLIGTTYPINAVVNRNGIFYVSLAGANVGNDPATSGTWWTAYIGRGPGGQTGSPNYGLTSTYTLLPLVYSAGFTFYVSVISNNLDNPTAGTGTWLLLGGSSTPLQFVYPIGAGPLWDASSKNAYHLPYGFLRSANQNPKEGQDPFLGAPSAPFQTDWVFEGDYFVSRYNGAVMLRFIADIIDVFEMDPMFCEGLAARIANECAPSLVEPPKLALTYANVRRHYAEEMREARLANALEIGYDTPPRDEYLSVRY